MISKQKILLPNISNKIPNQKNIKSVIELINSEQFIEKEGFFFTSSELCSLLKDFFDEGFSYVNECWKEQEQGIFDIKFQDMISSEAFTNFINSKLKI